jgi:hypothetical protein
VLPAEDRPGEGQAAEGHVRQGCGESGQEKNNFRAVNSRAAFPCKGMRTRLPPDYSPRSRKRRRGLEAHLQAIFVRGIKGRSGFPYNASQVEASTGRPQAEGRGGGQAR